MNIEENFLVTYGLHSFVTCAQEDRKPVFFISAANNQKMIRHAKSLITGCFGDAANIQVA